MIKADAVSEGFSTLYGSDAGFKHRTAIGSRTPQLFEVTTRVPPSAGGLLAGFWVPDAGARHLIAGQTRLRGQCSATGTVAQESSEKAQRGLRGGAPSSFEGGLVSAPPPPCNYLPQASDDILFLLYSFRFCIPLLETVGTTQEYYKPQYPPGAWGEVTANLHFWGG